MISKFGTWLFQSTPSARRATPITKPCSSKDFVFQSTPSARRATTSETSALSLLKYFNPRPPRGGRLIALHKHGFPVVFQSTPSARRATQSLLLCVRAKKTFQSTPSARRATGFEVACGLVGFISIHALREEGDVLLAGLFRVGFPISIHALREEGDRCRARRNGVGAISIHALREEGDGWNRSTRPSES